MKETNKITTDSYSFEKLRQNNLLYVDKTQYFCRLVTGGAQCFFCSRPRRFGKSLALSILHAIFAGRRELFEGLYIAQQDYDWQVFPVIHIDMARCNCTSAESLFDSLMLKLNAIAKEYDAEIAGGNPGDCFDLLISALKEKTGKGVVILIDEYDKPLTENISDPAEVEKVRRLLDSFYQIIKGQEPNERFVFMTGVTKFSKVSIFSKLNNLNDISLDYDYACMFGYTQKELEENFAPYIDSYIQETKADRTEFINEIKLWYDGFKFDSEAESVYNPVSIGQFFSKRCRFSNYWFATGTPALLVNLAKKQQLTTEMIDEAFFEEASLNTFDIAQFASGTASEQDLIQLLFQTGYLTITKRVQFGGNIFYYLAYPNYEVRFSFEKILLEVYTGIASSKTIVYALKVGEAVSSGSTPRIIELMQNMLSQIPYGIQLRDEKYYQSLMYLFFKMCGMEISAESETGTGRIDAVMEAGSHIYIFELKLNQSAEKAAEQIENKQYFQPFIERARDKGLHLHCVGISFCTDKAVRNISGWKELGGPASS